MSDDDKILGHDRVVLATVGALALLALVNSLGFWPLVVDDAFISLRYALNFIHGNGLVYNPGEHVEGFSDPLWVMIMSAGLAVGLPSLTGAKLVGYASHAVSILGAYLLAHELVQPRTRASALAIAIGTGFLAVSLPANWWPGAGLETTFYSALLVLGFWRMVYELRHEGARPWSAGLAAAALLTRPEAPLVVIGIVAGRGLPLLRGRRFKELGTWLAIFVVPFLLWFMFRMAWYGHPLAAPFYKKGDSGGLHAFDMYITPWTQLEGLFLLAGVAGLLGLAALRTKLAWPLLVGFAGQVFFVAYIGSDWMPNHRFVVPVLPLLAAGVGALAGFIGEHMPARAGWAATAGAAMLLAWQGWRSVPLERHYTADGDTFDRARTDEMWFPTSLSQPWTGHAVVPMFAMERLAPDASLVYTDIGMTGWIADWTIIDVSGLTDEVWSGATGANLEEQAAYLGERLPDWIILKQPPINRFEAISGSRWLVEHYELEQGPNDTLVARRFDAPRATDEQILANYELALEREPHSRRFHAQRMKWAAAVGTPAQKQRACEEIEDQFGDSDQLVKTCRRLASAKSAPRPDVTVQLLGPKLARYLPDGGKGARLARAVGKASAVSDDDAGGDAEVVDDHPQDAAALLASTAAADMVENPFARPGPMGIGVGWVTYPRKKDPRLTREDDALRWDAGGADAEAIQACGKKEPSTAKARVIGEWRYEGVSPAAADDPDNGVRIFLVALDEQGRWIRPPNSDKKFWTVLAGRGDLGWTPIEKTLELPEGAVETRLCVEVTAGSGTAWFKGLNVLAVR